MFQLIKESYQGSTDRALLDNSLTVKVGDLIAPLASTDNVVTNATGTVTADYLLGVVVGFSTSIGGVIGTGTSPNNVPQDLVTASDNTTNAKYEAVYVPLNQMLRFKATLSAVAGTTTHSDADFVWFNLTDARTVNEASVKVANDASAPYQVFSYGLDPDDSSKKTIICRIAKSIQTQ